MNLPEIVKRLLHAQAKYDSIAYANCFAEDAIVSDEGKSHIGKEAIKQWNESTNDEYHTQLEPIEFRPDYPKVILTVNVSGTFDGSPILLDYHFEIEKDLISTLKITLH